VGHPAPLGPDQRLLAGAEQGGRVGKLTSLAGWLREYGEAIEADLDRFYGLDLLDFYRGRITARALWVRLRNLPPEAATVTLARQQDPGEGQGRGRSAGRAERHLAPVRCLTDIPVAKSITDVGKFVNASGDEFSAMADQAG
jgi:hypothetical protein